MYLYINTIAYNMNNTDRIYIYKGYDQVTLFAYKGKITGRKVLFILKAIKPQTK